MGPPPLAARHLRSDRPASVAATPSGDSDADGSDPASASAVEAPGAAPRTRRWARLVLLMVLADVLAVLALVAGALGVASSARHAGDDSSWLALLVVGAAGAAAATFALRRCDRRRVAGAERGSTGGIAGLLVDALGRDAGNTLTRRSLRRAAAAATGLTALFAGLLAAGLGVTLVAHGLYAQSRRLVHEPRAVGTVESVTAGGSLTLRSASLATSLIVVRVHDHGGFMTVVVSDPTGSAPGAGEPGVVPGQRVALLVDVPDATAAFPGNPLVPGSKLVGLAIFDALLLLLLAWGVSVRLRVGRLRLTLLGEPAPAPPVAGSPGEAPAGAGAGGSFDAAWYRDPSGRHRLRYFDGSLWTGWVSDEEGVTASDPVGAQR